MASHTTDYWPQPREDMFDCVLANVVVELIEASDVESEDEIVADGILCLSTIQTTRYMTTRERVSKSIYLLSDILPSYDPIGFRRTIRMNRPQFNFILQSIKHHDVFKNSYYPVEVQLVIVLHRFGVNGNASSTMNLARDFGIGDGGTLNIFTKRVITAILALEKDVISWPSHDERQSISTYMSRRLIPQCIGFVDGTHISLSRAPQDDPISYFNRKGFYSLNVQLIIDPYKHIRSYHVGQPGKVHDAKVYSLMSMCVNPREYFSNDQFIIGDAAYKLTETVITPFRKSRVYTNQHDKFNTHLSTQRIAVEHVFGILKSRFSSLRSLRMIVDRRNGQKFACEWIVACLILYNLLHNVDPWIENDASEEITDQTNDLSDEDDEICGINKRDVLFQHILSYF